MAEENVNGETEAERTKAWEKRMKDAYENLKHPRLRILVETYYDFQKLRTATVSRLNLYNRFGMLADEQYIELSERVNSLTESESHIKKMIGKEIKNIPVWNEYLIDIKGIGSVMAGDLIGWIDDIGKFDTISKLWAFSVGKPGEKRERGKKLGYNPHLKTLMWKTGKQLLMANNELYRGIYEGAKKKYQDRDDIKKAHEGKKGYKLHIHLMSMRKMEKMFLSHLWLRWREIEGLPTSKPYVIAKLGHTTYINPPEEA